MRRKSKIKYKKIEEMKIVNRVNRWRLRTECWIRKEHCKLCNFVQRTKRCVPLGCSMCSDYIYHCWKRNEPIDKDISNYFERLTTYIRRRSNEERLIQKDLFERASKGNRRAINILNYIINEEIPNEDNWII